VRVSTFNVNRGIFHVNSRLSSWNRRLMTARRVRPRRGRLTSLFFVDLGKQWVYSTALDSSVFSIRQRFPVSFEVTRSTRRLAAADIEFSTTCWDGVISTQLGGCNCWRYSSSDMVGDECSLLLLEHGGELPWPNVSGPSLHHHGHNNGQSL